MKNLLLICFLLLVTPAITFGATSHTIEVEFSFTAPDDPQKQLIGYRLYKDEVQVCDTGIPSGASVSCGISSEDGTFDFSLTARYSDNTESPPSPAFPFTLTTSSPPVPLTAVISPTTTTGEIPFTVSFNGTSSTGDIASYNWSFGDSFSGTGSAISHTYTTPGTYSAVLQVVDQAGESHQVGTTITAQPQPIPLVAVISPTTTTGEVPFTVSFNGTNSTGDIASYNWSFGDNSSSTGSAISHTYTTPGTYTAVLQVVDQAGASHQVSTTITAQPQPIPLVAVISPTTTTGEVPFTVSFNGTNSTGDIASYNWSFGDNSSSTGSTTSHTYTSSGTFTALLQVVDQSGTSHQTTTTITVQPATPVGNPHTIEVEFSFTAPDDPQKQLTGYRLYKDDLQACETGVPSGSSVSCDIISEDGTFDFKLKALYSDNTESPASPAFPFTIDSTTPPPPAPLLAVISPITNTGPIPFSLTFDGNSSTGDIATYAWNFGDGSSSTGPNASHTYSSVGTYTVVLQVTDQSGESHQTTTTITAQPGVVPPEPPTAVISSTTAAGNAPLNVTFNGIASTTSTAPGVSITSYSWTFGDGADELTGQTVSHTFTEAGTYYTQLTVEDSQGLTDSVSTPIVVVGVAPENEKPVAIMAANVTSPDTPLSYSFDASQSNDPDGSITSYDWNFGDGATGSGLKPLHTYASAATYTATLQVTDDRGETSTTNMEIVCEAPLTDDIHIEIGEVTLKTEWTTIDFAESFTEPVIVAGPPTYNGGQPVLVRIRNVNENSFQVRLQEWDYLDGIHTLETFSYMVIEKGTYTLDSGVKLEAGTFSGSSAFKTINLEHIYDFTPVVLTQVLTENEIDAVTGRSRNINQYSFEYKLQEMESSTQEHIGETIGYIAWEPGKGEVAGLLYEIGNTPLKITHKWFSISFETDFQEQPFFLAGMQTTSGGNTSAVRSKELSQSSVQIKIEEEQSRDSETLHTAKEIVGYFTITSAPSTAE